MTVLRRLLTDTLGTMAVETALVAPALVLLGIGGFQVSDMVSSQHNLESAAAMGEQIALASKPDSQAKLDTMKGIIHVTTGVPTSNISPVFKYRCGITTTLQDSNNCGADPAWMFVQITVSDTFTPFWTSFGVGRPVNLQVVRTVQIS